jgi:imidazolonepropionase-like amidohydrolase
MDTGCVSWSVCAVPLPDGDRPVDLWVDAAGCLVTEPVAGAERLPGRYVVPGLVDAHAHPAVAAGPGGPVALSGAETLNVLATWADCGVCLVRDAGSPGGLVLQLDLISGMPRLQAAGRFLAPAGRYFPALLPEGAPQQRLTELALGELARGGRWVKVIADFPPVVDGMPSGTARPTYTSEAIEAMVTAVHAAGGRVAAHVTTDSVSQLVRAGVDSIEHGTAIDESALRLMAQTGAAWTPTLCAVLGVPGTAPEAVRRRAADYQQRLHELLPLADRLGVPVLAGTDTAGTIAREVALLAEHGLNPAAALAAATTTGYRFLGEPFDRPGQPTTLVTYQNDPREDLATLSTPIAIIIDGVRVR